MQRVSFVRLTAESSSVLDGEETCRPELATHKSYYTALRGCGSTPALRVLDVFKTPLFL
jgi:hypothetical protein